MQKAGSDGLGTGPQQCQRIADLHRMNDIRLTALAKLPFMLFLGKQIGPGDQIDVFRLVNIFFCFLQHFLKYNGLLIYHTPSPPA